MAVGNPEVLRKAVITTDAITTAGKLNPEQADKFIDYVFDVTKLKGNARTIKFRSEQYYIDKIGVGARVAVPKVEAKDPGVRRGVSTSRVTLHPQEIMCPFEISYQMLEQNLEGEALAEKLIRLFSIQFGNDMEELCIQGDQLGRAVLQSEYIDGGDPTRYVRDNYLKLQDGWLTLARAGHGVDADQANVSNRIFSRLLNALPEKFKRNRGQLRFFCSTDLEQNYREKVSARATGKGDQALMSEVPLTPYGIPLIGVPLLPMGPRIVEHVTLTGTTAVPLLYKGITSVVVLPSDLDQTPTLPYTEGSGNDYNLTTAADGTVSIARDGASTIPSGATVKVTYSALAQIILTHESNMIVGLNKDTVRLERDRDIFAGVLQFALTADLAVEYEEADAIAFAYNVGTDV